MDLFNVIITDKAESQLESYTDYIFYKLCNETAAKSLLRDARETQEMLSKVAANLQYCKNPALKRLGYRPINFLAHRYVMIYRVNNKDVYVEAIYHQLQDYENTFEKELKEQ